MTQTASRARPDRAATVRDLDDEVVAPVYSRYSDLVVDTAEGALLHTADGREVVDMGSGIGVTNLGHRHPAVTAAAHAQLDRLWHLSVTAINEPMVRLAASLVRVTPPGLDRVFLCNSGAEAVEAALKLARRATGRSEVIAFDGAFHGRTYGAVTLTASQAKYHAGIGPLLPGVHHVPYPYPLRMGGEAAALATSLGAIERLLTTRVDARDVAAVVVEPLLGEGGYVVPPAGFLPALRRLCDEHGILLVADEVQSGFARTGRMFAVEHTQTVPDILCMAKAMGNGLPIGGIVAAEPVATAWHHGEHGTTFGGNPVACAAGIAVIEAIERENLCERAVRLGGEVMARAESWQERAPVLREVRGRGLMVGLEFVNADGTPAAGTARQIRHAALERDVLLLSCGSDHNVIRLVPPLTIDEEHLGRAMDVLEACVLESAR